jgi:hypothetical protein
MKAKLIINGKKKNLKNPIGKNQKMAEMENYIFVFCFFGYWVFKIYFF